MIKCIKDFYCLNGELRFTKGVEYKFMNNKNANELTIECGNYHLHKPYMFKEYFKMNYNIKPTDL